MTEKLLTRLSIMHFNMDSSLQSNTSYFDNPDEMSHLCGERSGSVVECLT